MLRRTFGAALAVIGTSVGISGLGAGGAGAVTACTGTPTDVQVLSITDSTVTGYVALPTTAPKGVVALEHGYQETAKNMSGQLTQIASQDDVIAVAVHNDGEVDNASQTSSRGWDVTQGAQDAIAATRWFQSQCQGDGSPFVNTLMGESMGGDTSGLAAAAHATAGDGSPLFRYWFDVSGVSNLPETWLVASIGSLASVSQQSSYAAQAAADIKAETGGTPATVLSTFLADSPVTHGADMKASGLKGAWVFHAIPDGFVTFDEGAQMTAALLAAGVPVQLFTSVFQTPGSKSETLDGDVLTILDPNYVSPLAGHVNGIVLSTAMAQLQQVYVNGAVPSGDSITLSDGQLHTVPLVP